MFYREERVALFIDGANLYSAARALGFDIDYKKLLGLFQSKSRLIRAFYYTALAEDQEYSPLRPLIDWLDYNGYTMVTKPLKEFTDAYGRRKVKGNMDIELAVDLMQMAVLRRRRFPPPGRGRPAPRRARQRGLDDPHPAADGRRRIAPPGRCVCRAAGSDAADPAHG
jgi:NYN domain